eukprot:426686-Alexandrium_andersonii.AAC.1
MLGLLVSGALTILATIAGGLGDGARKGGRSSSRLLAQDNLAHRSGRRMRNEVRYRALACKAWIAVRS